MKSLLAGALASLAFSASLFATPIAVPQIDAVSGNPVTSGTVSVDLSVPVGKCLVLPVAGSGGVGTPLSYTVSSSNPAVNARVRTGYSSLLISSTFTATVSGTDTAATSGTMELLLFRDLTPMTAGVIGGLAESGFYNDTTFHRVIPGFMIQGGDPLSKDSNTNNDGQGGPGFAFENEFSPALIFSGSGQLAMANSGWSQSTLDATNGCQFFITVDQTRFLDFNHTIFGQLVRGYDVLQAITGTPVDTTTKDANGNPIYRPYSNVTMTDVQVVPDNTDACLFLTATGTGSSLITITANNGINSSTPVTFQIDAVKDDTNDPPILNPLDDSVASATKPLVVRLPSLDLEADPLLYGSEQTNSPARAKVKFGFLNNKVTISPKPDTFKGPANMAFAVMQLGATSRGSSASPYDIKTLTVGMGDKRITAFRNMLTGSTNQAYVFNVARFTDADPNGTPSQYTATINWGDDYLSGTSSVAISGSNGQFTVTGTHGYLNPGTYPVRVTINGNKGAKDDVISTAVISSSDLLLASSGIVVSGTSQTGGEVARFSDATPSDVSAYTATVTWGDGSVTPASIQSNGSFFSVMGSHTYTEDGRYPLAVQVTESGTTYTAWSTATVQNTSSGILPPFKMIHLGVIWGSVSQTTSASGLALSGALAVVNSGSLTASKAKLTFYVSDDTSFDPAADTQVKFANGASEMPITKLLPGGRTVMYLTQSAAGDWRVKLPTGSAGKYLFAVPKYTDLLLDQMPANRAWGVKIPTN